MNARDELALTIHTHHCIESVHNEDCMFWADDHESAEAVRAAGYSKPRTINNVDDLNTVYAGSIIRDADGQMWGIDGATDQLFAIPDGVGEPYHHDDVMLPAAVVFEAAA